MALTKADFEASALQEAEDTLSQAVMDRSSQQRGGYDCQFLGEIPQDGQCPICHLVYRHPHQMRCCGKRICAGCVGEIKESRTPCPLCNEAKASSYLDKACMQLLSNYKVNCPNSSEGCEWEGQLAELDRHLNLEPTTEKQLEGCQFSRIKCRFCFKLFERHFINNHQSSECPKRPYECEYCEYSATFEEVTQQHSNECPSAPVTCPNNCEIAVLRCELEHHRNHDCPLEIEQCEFRAVGCQVELPREEMSEHERQSVVEHSVALSTTLQRAMADITTLQGEMQALTKQTSNAMRDSREERITAQSTRLWRGVVLLAIVTIVSIAVLASMVTMRSGQHSVNGVQYREDQTGFCRFDNGMMESECIDKEGREEWHDELDSRMEQEQKERRNELDSRMEQEQKERRNELDSRMEQEQKERRNELDSRMEQERNERQIELDRNVEEVMLQVKEYDTARQDRRLQEQLSELQDKLDQEIKKRQKIEIKNSHKMDVDVIMLQVRQNAILKHLQMVPHEDIFPFEFEMKEFTKYRESGGLWYSPPFYTDINGYKMCIRVDARGKARKYISVAVFLMAGVADDDLNWPFREDIKVELINQASSSRWNPLSYFRSKKESHFKTFEFKTMRLSKSNKRVTSGERALDGLQISRFIAHDNLENDSKKGTQYLKDDTLKFRISASSSS